MRIASVAVQMDASHHKQQSHEVKTSVRVVAASRAAADSVVASAPAGPTVVLSEGGKALQSGETAAIQKCIDETESDPRLRLIRSLIALLTGREIKSLVTVAQTTSAASAANVTVVSELATTSSPTAANGPVFEYSRRESYSESEQTNFSAAGVINTADGKQIAFSLSLSMSRSYHQESSTTITIGDTRRLQDPLVLNFDGEAAQLTDQRFAFDLDADGDNESINFVAGGSGFLAFDRNGDGQINDGSELFGAASGNGFGELAAFDDDHNGWIDENDAAFTKLQVWTKDSNGNDQLATLKEANVGAIGLDHVATAFDFKDADNDLQGRIRSSGVFLQEDGKVGTVQQIDLAI